MTGARLKILAIEGREGSALPLLTLQPGLEILPAEKLAVAERLLSEARLAGAPCDAVLIDVSGGEWGAAEMLRRARPFLGGLPIVALHSTHPTPYVSASGSGRIRNGSETGPAGSEPDPTEDLISEGVQTCLEKEGLTGKTLAALLRQAVFRHRAEARRFRALFDSAPIGILLAVGRKIVMANNSALEALDCQAGEFGNISVLDFFPAHAHPNLIRALDAQAGEAAQDQSFDALLQRPRGGSVRCRVFIKEAMVNDAPAVAVYLARLDLGGPSQPMGSSQSEADPLFSPPEKMDALARFASRLSHDFNNLFAAINGYCDHLSSLSETGGAVAKGLAIIRKAGEEAADMTRSLMAFSGPGPGSTEDTEIDTLVARKAETLRARLPPGIKLELETGASRGASRGAGRGSASGFARIEAEALDRILEVLVDNALDAMPAGGTLTLSTGLFQPGDHEVFTHLSPGSGSHVVVNVEDTGTGMGREALARLFEPFNTTKQGGRGNGLGLAALYGKVRDLGGGIAVASAIGQGTLFRIFLPASGVTASTVGVPEGNAAPGKPGLPMGSSAPDPIWGEAADQGTILVVDDESTLRELIRLVLERSGFRVIEAASLGEAVEKVESRAEPIDLLVTDVMLRGSGGDELAESLRARQPGLQTIFISGHTLEHLAGQGIRIPADAFLEKPFSPSQLVAKVRIRMRAARPAS